MKKSTVIVLLACFFVVGAAVPTFLMWNPAHWEWAERLTGRIHGGMTEVGSSSDEAQLWTCGMHPQVIQDEPGTCPICGMNLVPLRQDTGEGTAEATEGGERKILYWRAPMDPNYISDEPGKSPMGMDMVPVYEDEEPAVTGVRVDPSFLQNFAVKTAVVEQGVIPIDIRTVGVLGYNEKNIASVNTKIEGWIENAYVNYVGEPVERGQVLFEIYSPQLVTTQQEYLAALDYVRRLEAKGNPDAVARANSLLESSRERLRYWDITEEQIDQLRETGKVTRTLKIFSPVSGFVVKKMDRALEGMKLTPGMDVFQIADTSTVWAEIEVYEYQLQHVRLGQMARITVDAFPGRQWSGKIIYLDPAVDQRTRTLKAFVEVANSRKDLRPEMYVNVALQAPNVSGAVIVPEQSVLHTGERSVVIVQKAEGVFEPREIQLGATGNGYHQVRSGLRAGEVIVTSSQFLIDSESNLRAAISKMLGEREGASGEPSTEAAPPVQQQ